MSENTMDRLRDMLCRELEEIVKKNSLDAAMLGQVDKLTHSIKSIDTIKAMEDAGYSEADGYNSYGRGYSPRRDNRGRYSRDSYGYPGRRGYSRDDGKEDMLDQLYDMLEDTQDEKMRASIQRTIDEMKR